MPDAYRKIQLNDPWPRSASAYNAMVDAAVAEKSRQFDGGGEGPTSTRNASIVRVKNETGAALGRFNVVGLGEPIFLPSDSEDAFLREVCFRADTPAVPDHWGRFAVLLEPAPVDRVVRAYVAGVCPVRVNVVDVDDEWADVEDSETGRLKSGAHGAAQVLWKEADSGGYGYDTGEQWCVVRIGTQGNRCVAQSTSLITKRSGTALGTGTATLYYVSDSGVLTATSQDKTVYNMSVEKGIKSGAYFQYKTDFGKILVDWADCGDLS